MKNLETLIQELCPDGVEFVKLGDVCKSLSKGTLKTTDLVEQGEFPVINSGRELYGYYNQYNNEGNAITVAARGEYAGFITYMKNPFWARSGPDLDWYDCQVLNTSTSTCLDLRNY